PVLKIQPRVLAAQSVEKRIVLEAQTDVQSQIRTQLVIILPVSVPDIGVHAPKIVEKSTAHVVGVPEQEIGKRVAAEGRVERKNSFRSGAASDRGGDVVIILAAELHIVLSRGVAHVVGVLPG